MTDDCLICDRIAQIQAGTNPYFVAELTTGYAVIGDHQFFRSYSLFLCKEHVPELHNLERDYKLRFLDEMSATAQAVFEAFQPVKLNYEMLGNSEAHLHWHLFPRHHDDPNPRYPVWMVDHALHYAEENRPNPEELLALKRSLMEQLERIAPEMIVRRFND
jgi:diadenosine tetraphosphate (Ap4A) HIT family hydrolase